MNSETRQQGLRRQIDRLARHITQMQGRSERIVRWRTAYFFAGALGLFLALQVSDEAGLLVFLLWLGGFVALVRAHNRVLASIQRFQAWQAIKREHIARMTIDWAGLPPDSARSVGDHPFAHDIDLTGDVGVHRLLDTTVSRGGADRLLDWLLTTTPDAERIAAHQAVVQDLLPLTHFRDRLRLETTLAAPGRRRTGQPEKWDESGLLGWLRTSAAAPTVSLPTLLGLVALSVLTLTLLLLTISADLPPLWIATGAAFALFSGWQWSRLGDLFSQAMALKAALDRVTVALHRLETTDFSRRDALRRRSAAVVDAPQPPSQQLRRIARILTAVSLRGNPVIWIMVNLALPWDIFFAYRLAHSRGVLAETLPAWLDAWYDVEAFSALATFAYLNPGTTLPTLKPAEAVLHGEGLGHPLIPHDERVVNDFTLDRLGQVVLITGSNMSGKSSFLRTLGINLALAYSGGFVAANRLELGLFRLYSCIRVTDSVVDGISYFYAEVKRLKALLDALQTPDAPPLFFLIDEIFRGTNNRERLLGSRAYIQALVGGRGMGLISTHDLELVHLADDDPAIRNMHFREHIDDDRMAFDYRLRPGPSPTTNALKIMALEGLPVDESPG